MSGVSGLHRAAAIQGGSSCPSKNGLHSAPAPRRRWYVPATAVLIGLVAGLLLAEASLRLFPEAAGLSAFSRWRDAHVRIYRASPTLGYEPIPGEGGYNEYGVLDYGYRLSRKDRLLRILVLGDSISHRRYWVEGLQRRLRAFVGPQRFVEIWNAGVEGYNTVQEEAYLRQTGVHLRADMVLVQFHLNDFLPLPVIFQDRTGNTVHLPDGEHGRVFLPLFRLSYIYRYLLMRWRPTRKARLKASRQQIERAILGIQTLCREQDLDLLFVIFPLFRAREDYSDTERLWYRWSLDILKRARIPRVDLHHSFPADRSIESFRELPEDPWHPDVAGHRVAARTVFQVLRYRPIMRRFKRNGMTRRRELSPEG